MRLREVLVLALLGAAVLVPRASAAGASEKDVFQRLFSPCCYRETLDVHVSPIAEQLRMEIRDRLARGEAANAVVGDMARRYGDEVLARPPGRASTLAMFCAAGILASGLLAFALWRSRRAAAPASRWSRPMAPSDGEDGHLIDALDDELAALE